MPDLKITCIPNNNITSSKRNIQNFCGAKTSAIPQDTIEISSKKEKNNLGLKLLLGGLAIGATILALVMFYKTKSVKASEELSSELKEIQQHLKNIFEKDFSDKETKDFVDRYKRIINIADDREFANKCFNELKNDYAVENRGLKLHILDNPVKTKNGAGIFVGCTEALTRWIETTVCNGKNNTFKNLFHEMKHVKQNELMYKTDAQRLIRQKVRELEKSNNESWQQVLRENGGDIEKARQFVKTEVENVYSEIFGYLQPIKPNTPEYEKGLKYLANQENRIPPGPNYYGQILEKEAQFCEEEAEKIFKLLENL